MRAYTQDLRTFARFTQDHQLTDPLSKDDILAYHRHLRDELGANGPAANAICRAIRDHDTARYPRARCRNSTDHGP